jgi:hypothetical protein
MVACDLSASCANVLLSNHGERTNAITTAAAPIDICLRIEFRITICPSASIPWMMPMLH